MADSLEDLSDEVKQLLDRAVDVAEQLLRRDAAPRIGAIATRRYMRDAGKRASPGNVTLGPNATDTLRIVSGRLARSLTGARTDRGAPQSINRVRRVTDTVVRLVKGTTVDYAAVHEEGFQGTVDVRPHRRTMTHGFGPESAYPQTVTVTRHARQMDIPARPYLGPATEDYRKELQEKGPEELRTMVRQLLDAD
jgi:phage gpG-like protein